MNVTSCLCGRSAGREDAPDGTPARFRSSRHAPASMADHNPRPNDPRWGRLAETGEGSVVWFCLGSVTSICFAEVGLEEETRLKAQPDTRFRCWDSPPTRFSAAATTPTVVGALRKLSTGRRAVRRTGGIETHRENGHYARRALCAARVTLSRSVTDEVKTVRCEIGRAGRRDGE